MSEELIINTDGVSVDILDIDAAGVLDLTGAADDADIADMQAGNMTALTLSAAPETVELVVTAEDIVRVSETDDGAEITVLHSDGTIDSARIYNGEGQYTRELNNPIYVNQFCGVAWSYYDHRDDNQGNPVFTYGQTTCLDDDWQQDNQIDCSTLAGLVIRGLDFESGPYSFLSSDETDTGDGTDRDAGLPDDDPDATDSSWHAADVDANPAYDWAINPGVQIRNAAQLAAWYHRNGRIVYANEDFREVEKGDIVFYARKDDQGEWIQPDRYLHISHVAIIVNKLDNPGDIDAGYPYKHTMIECTHFATNPQPIVNRCLEKVNVDDIVLFARPRLGTISPDDVRGNEAASKSSINAIYTAGIRYLTSTTVTGLPDGVTSGLGMILTVERVENKKGKPYAIIQRLVDARNNREWRRTQYCYSNDYTPTTGRWTAWVEI